MSGAGDDKRRPYDLPWPGADVQEQAVGDGLVPSRCRQDSSAR